MAEAHLAIMHGANGFDAIAAAQHGRLPAATIELGAWMRARLAAP